MHTKKNNESSESNYTKVYKKSILNLERYLNVYSDSMNFYDWKKLYYKDPDPCSIKKRNKIVCTADGLLSIHRIYTKYGLSTKLINDYRTYRKTPIIHFPSEKWGVNMSRTKVFGDRIDHTLFDLQRYCKGGDYRLKCKLKSAYELPKTKAWLESFDYDFKAIIEWFGVWGIFVNENYEVYDLEYDDGTIITDYSDSYEYEWSDNYYENVKKKIKEFEARLEEEH